MKNIVQLMLAALLTVGVASQGKAEAMKMKDGGNRSNNSIRQTTAGCAPSSTFEWLNINNVRTRVNAGGDMWWDLPGGTGSKYFIPANGSATSLFAGSLWIAGMDVNHQLKCAAVRFRQGADFKGGNDFWTGPLTIDGSAAIDPSTCAAWDKIFKINRAEVDEFLSNLEAQPNGEMKLKEGYTMPKIIKEWPAHPDEVEGTQSGVSHYGAPFYDRNNNGYYEPEKGDYPYYDIDNELCHTKIPTMEEQRMGTVYGTILADQVLKGDQTLWWIFNDKGNSHTESKGEAIGMEIRAQAFGFSTNDEINNMSFYSYEIINRSTYELTGTYFSPWTDVDLGYAFDDYVGCDVRRGLGYGYNGASTDGSGQPETYGSQPPAIGIDFFQGPYMDADGLDNPKYTYTYVPHYEIDPATGDTIVTMEPTNPQQIVDESINGVNFGNGIVDDERFGMRRFLYHNNDNTPNGDPKTAVEYYNMLRGIWRNGNRMQYGGNAYTGPNVEGPACDFMFPGDSDPWNWGTGGVVPNGGYTQNGKYWTEEQCQNAPYDRRFMQSAGPFTLKPGAVNYITFGVPWARATSGGPWASVELLRVVDDKCQALFDNCFKVIDGPSAPDLTIRELDQQVIIYLSNSALSNNFKEGYVELDPEIPMYLPGDTAALADRYYRFEGYKVYQLANAEVAADELFDTDKARLVFQCDIQNNVTRMINYVYDDYIGANVPHLMVEGGNGGIKHSFVLNRDLFASGDNNTLVNHRTYYYMAVAYAYNNFMDYSQEPGVPHGLEGQKKPYLEGRKNIKIYSAVPHKIVNGTVMQSVYGDRPSITRIVGVGNGGNELELSDSTVAEILRRPIADSVNVFGSPNYPIAYHPTYKRGFGPVNVKVIDPLNVKTADYSLKFGDPKKQLMEKVTGNLSVYGDTITKLVNNWYLTNLNTGEVYASDTTTAYADEKMFIDLGISVCINQPYFNGPQKVGKSYNNHGAGADTLKTYYQVISPDNGMISSSLQFQDSTDKWLDGIRDVDLPGEALNWIRSGTFGDQNTQSNNDFYVLSGAGASGSRPYDPDQNYEKIAFGTWAPYVLGSVGAKTISENPSPVYPGSLSGAEYYFQRNGSVDIVLTADKSKWTRCPVVEMCGDKALAQGGASRFNLRKAPSVDKEGNPYTGDWQNAPAEGSNDPNAANYIAAQGMSWFPGYVIDVESGARLNLFFSEDSYLADLNGRDMMFNPPALRKTTVDGGATMQLMDPVVYSMPAKDPVFGGKHYVYIMGMDRPNSNPDPSIHIPGGSPYKDFDCPAYDGGKYLFNAMNFIQSTSAGLANGLNIILYRQCQWIGMPMAVEGHQWLPANNDARIRIRVSKPYSRGYYERVALDSVYSELNINNLNPEYRFSIQGLNPILNDPQKTENDLDLITIVPNPYYAYAQHYEGTALTNRVKITNLPVNCVVTIYSINGTKIRQFKKDNNDPSIEWDLTNFANTPVASGFYLIHVKDNTSGGERVVKFFGAMRKVDLNTF